MAVANLALTFVLTDDSRYLERARAWIEIATGYPHWGRARLPDQDLDAAWLSFGLGLGYDWLKDHLPAPERDALRDRLHLQGQRLYEFAVASEGTWWGSAYWQNHNWICHAGLATVAYALMGCACPYRHALGPGLVHVRNTNMPKGKVRCGTRLRVKPGSRLHKHPQG